MFKHIQTYPDIIRHNEVYSRITLVYPKLWHIQNQRHIQNHGLFRTLGYSEPEAYSEPCKTSTMEGFEKQLTDIIIFVSYDYFRNISFSCPLVHETNMVFNASLIFTPEFFILCQKVWVPGRGARDREF